MKTTTHFRTIELAYMSALVALTAICAWISIPLTVPFTMQTFAVFLTLQLVGGKRGTFVVLVYLLLGAVGVPVFAGFTGGIGILFGSTGGYLLGFLGTTLLHWLLVRHSGKHLLYEVGILVMGLFLCYALGTIWFVAVYTSSTGAVGIGTALAWCVIPYIIPDCLKIALAVLLAKRLRPQLRGLQ